MLETLQVFERPLQPLSPPFAQVQLAASAAESVLFVLGSMASHLHVLIATNWH